MYESPRRLQERSQTALDAYHILNFMEFVTKYGRFILGGLAVDNTVSAVQEPTIFNIAYGVTYGIGAGTCQFVYRQVKACIDDFGQDVRYLASIAHDERMVDPRLAQQRPAQQPNPDTQY